jgi:NAD(P)H-flavin reductase
MLAESFRARLVQRRRLSSRVSELTLELLESKPFRWLGGQYVLVGSDASVERFAFSIARADDLRDPARLVLAVGDGSSAEPLLVAQPGSELVVLGPHGKFTWRPAPGALLIGVGTGVAPLKALVEEALAHGFHGPIVLLGGFRSEGDVLWSAELAELSSSHPEFRYVPTLTLPGNDWRGLRGRVQEHLAEVVASLPAHSAVYVCGKTLMVETCRERLSALGVGPEDIRAESY